MAGLAGAFALLASFGAASASAQDAGASLQLRGVPATLAPPASFPIVVSGSTGAASDGAVYAIYGPAPCAATVETQLQASPDEVLATAEANEAPPLGFDGSFIVRARGIGSGVSSPGLYTVCVFMEASEEVEPAEEESLIAVASATFTVLGPRTGASRAAAPRRARATRCVVPHLRGRRLNAAKTAIRQAHCALGSIRRTHSRHVRRGRVIWQSRTAGRRLPRSTKVSVLLSMGRAG